MQMAAIYIIMVEKITKEDRKMKQILPLLEKKIYIPAVIYMLFGVLGCLLSTALLLYAYHFGTNDMAMWIKQNYREGASAILFSFNITVCFTLLLDAEHHKRTGE